jgi:competence protein ComEA
VQFIREQIAKAISGGETVNRRLVLLVGLAVAAIVAILVSLNSAKPVAAQPNGQISPIPIALPDCYVHVVGEVAKPGIYDLPSDSRVFDAIFAAGGFSDKADQASINLARTLSDGEQIIVQTKGATPMVGSAASTAKLISLNRGSQAELEVLPGVGPTLAARIIDWRLANGGFKKIEDLKNVTGIGNKLFMQIKAKASL